MYKNEIEKTSAEDLEGKELKISELIIDKQNKFREELKALEIAHYLMLWLKYYRLDKTTYNLCALSELKCNIVLNDEEQDRIISKSKQILSEKYHITIECEDPLILSSDVPFSEIDEKGDFNKYE